MELQKNRSFKKMENEILDIAKKYFVARNLLKNSTRYLSNDNYDDNDPLCSYMNRVKTAYQSMDEGEQNIINNEFFYHSYLFWWQAFYSKSTFYRIKKEAMKHFLEAFNNA